MRASGLEALIVAALTGAAAPAASASTGVAEERAPFILGRSHLRLRISPSV